MLQSSVLLAPCKVGIQQDLRTDLPMSLKYHKYLDNSFTDEQQCPKPVYIGYFPFAVDVTLTDPKPSSTHRPTEDMKLLLRFEYLMFTFGF